MGTVTRLPVHHACELCGEPKRAFIHAVENRTEEQHDYLPHYKHTLVLDKFGTSKFKNTYVFMCVVDGGIFHVTKGNLWLPSNEELVRAPGASIWSTLFTQDEETHLSGLMDKVFGPQAGNRIQWLDGKSPWGHG